jgi:hypothetical protein
LWRRKSDVGLYLNSIDFLRAGQWARRLCINDSLDTGSILPYLTQAKAEGYGVIVLNPNNNSVQVKTTQKKKSSKSKKAKKESEETEEVYLYIFHLLLLIITGKLMYLFQEVTHLFIT